MDDLAKWQIHPPSLFGRLYSLKMNVLPKILYLFRTLPVALIRSDLVAFQRKMLFIWGYKRPRGKKHTLYTPKKGSGLEVWVKYFYAAQLAQLIQFHTTRSNHLWVQAESCSCPSKPISHMLWLPSKQRPTIPCPSLLFSLGIWDRLSRAFKFKSPHSLLALLFQNQSSPWALPPKISIGGLTSGFTHSRHV